MNLTMGEALGAMDNGLSVIDKDGDRWFKGDCCGSPDIILRETSLDYDFPSALKKFYWYVEANGGPFVPLFSEEKL